MRTLPIALVAVMLTIPSAGFSQDQGPVGGKVGRISNGPRRRNLALPKGEGHTGLAP